MEMRWKVMFSLCAGAAAAVAGGLARSRYERNQLVVEETTIPSPKVTKPVTLVFLSDLHDKEFGHHNERLLQAVRSRKPDAVLIGGDIMVAKPGLAGLEVTKRLLQGLRGLAPVYYANGNHEQRLKQERQQYGTLYDEFLELLRECNVCYLQNRSVEAGADIRISGLDIDQAYYRNLVPAKMGREDIEARIGRADETRFQILLAHSPLFFDAYAAWGADLSLAGHFHGGTIRLPLLGGVMTPQLQFFLPWCAGTFEKQGRRMMVSRGLGTHSINLRIGNKPQVIVVKLTPPF